MPEYFTKEQMDEISSKLVISNPNYILMYLNICFIIFIFYILYNHAKNIKKNKKLIYQIYNKIDNIASEVNYIENSIDDISYEIDDIENNINTNNTNNNITKDTTKDNYMNPDSDPRYLISRSQKGVSNNSLMDTINMDFFNNPMTEDSRLLNALQHK